VARKLAKGLSDFDAFFVAFVAYFVVFFVAWSKKGLFLGERIKTVYKWTF
jgi:hypothetical protein